MDIRHFITVLNEAMKEINPEANPDYDPELDAADAKLDRQQKIVDLIRHAFAKLQIAVDPDDRFGAISYEEEDREAAVILDAEPDGWPLERLIPLLKSGLGSNFRVAPHRSNNIELRFRVNPDLDHAV